jgi:heme exporter protein C
MKTLFNVLAVCTALLLGYGFCQAMYIAPTEATMGDVQRIFYYHLPSAWVAFLLFFVNFLASVWYLVRRTIGADALALASAEVGVSFCTIVLITGPIWARPIWGIWWTWDARLTSTLVLWLIYVSYLVLRHYATGGQIPVLAAALGIFGFLDVPIVYMAIRWFRTQHPQPVIGGGAGSGLDPAMWHAVLWNLAAFAMLALMFVWIRYRQALAEQALEEAHAQASLDYDAETETEGAQ